MDIVEIITSNLWAVLTTILTFLLLIVAVLYPRYQSRKELSYKLLSREPIVKGMHGVEIRFNGNSIPEPHLCSLGISNTGRIPIARGDYEGAITIGFRGCPEHPGQSVRVLAFEVERRTPDDLHPTIELTAEGKVQLGPLLLNPGDGLRLRFLLDYCFDRQKIDVGGHILGVKAITAAKENVVPVPLAIAMLSIIVVASAATYAAGSALLAVSLAVSILTAVLAGSLQLLLRRISRAMGEEG